MRRYGLIGYPLGHSFSKSYFAEKFLRENIIGCSYDNFPIREITLLPGLLKSEPELCGLNVTIPYKSDVFKYLDFIDPEAAEIGAVNVIKIKREADSIRLHGFNSDVTGIMDSLAPHISPTITSAIVLGTGGSSRAVRYSLGKLGLKIVQVSRTLGPGVIDYASLDPSVLSSSGLIVNTTPLGMYPDTATKPDIDYTRLTENHILFDLVYNPEITSFLQAGIDRGCQVITGLKMLHSQAEKAWEIWNNPDL